MAAGKERWYMPAHRSAGTVRAQLPRESVPKAWLFAAVSQDRQSMLDGGLAGRGMGVNCQNK